MKTKRVLHAISSIGALLVYAAILTGATLLAATHPKNQWDMLGYIGVIESWRTADGQSIHDEAYSAIRGLPEYDELIGRGECQGEAYAAYRSDVAQNSAHFAQQLPILAVKPLYVIIISRLHRVGLSYTRSFAILSAIAYFGLGAITWIWLSRFWSPWAATLFSSILILNPEILSVGRSTTPDALALALIAIGLYMLLESPDSIWGPSLLLVAIWVRPDALILIGMLFVTSFSLRVIPSSISARLGLLSNWKSLRSCLVKGWEWLFLCVIALLSYTTIQVSSKFYSWSTLFYHSFVGYLVTPADTFVKITPRLYFHVAATNARSLLGNSGLDLFLLTGILGALLHRKRYYTSVTVCVMVSVLVHFVFFPSDAPRFHLQATYFLPVSLVIACAQYVTPRWGPADRAVPQSSS